MTNLGVLGIPLLFFNSCWQNDEKRHNCGIFNNLSGADNAYCVLHSLQDITLEESQGRQVYDIIWHFQIKIVVGHCGITLQSASRTQIEETTTQVID